MVPLLLIKDHVLLGGGGGEFGHSGSYAKFQNPSYTIVDVKRGGLEIL